MGPILILLMPMILELLIMKLTMDTILQHCNSLAYEQEVRAQADQLKARLMKLMADYEMGVIDQKTYSKIESEIMTSLSKLTQQISSKGENPSSSSNLGLGF